MSKIKFFDIFLNFLVFVEFCRICVEVEILSFGEKRLKSELEGGS